MDTEKRQKMIGMAEGHAFLAMQSFSGSDEFRDAIRDTIMSSFIAGYLTRNQEEESECAKDSNS